MDVVWCECHWFPRHETDQMHSNAPISAKKSRQELLLHQPARQRSTWSHRSDPPAQKKRHAHGTSWHIVAHGLVILKVMPRLFSIDEEVRGTSWDWVQPQLRELSQWIVTKMLPKKWLRHSSKISKSVNDSKCASIFTINIYKLYTAVSEWI